MRSSRLLAASTLAALTLCATAGAATASAVGITSSPSPSPSPTATAPSTTPSTTPPSTTAPGTPAPTTPAKPTNLPTAPTPTPTDGTCKGSLLRPLKVTGTGLANTTLVKGGPAQETTVTFENTTPVDLKKFDTYFFFTDVSETEPVINPVTWARSPSPSR
ncbi:hypothetical protein ABTZ03_40250 [Kitasatospora sp. NPDC096077]|uniref:hypothetical protein n=1 Tax=Kitasatospora sp. NPDC096077 TaxID=3155544 RepID=UPI00331B085F